ncbi:MAG: acetyl-CoA decarbonylase/synthase complex subunit delta [Candidatus Omnitrophica bacterium]|nr:acetyl-CoA decarbonylase/synthase complex subunit delta [Candidatus Omnitrophota bacterium]MBU1871759.1 acetyl-CoA decarbonylase/synthase complex subunit delta [Candidatus Omnitrophota bacterium]
MAELVYQKWSGKINETIIGAGPLSIKIGAEEGLPFLFKEGKIPNQPRIAFEVWDIAPADWPDELAGQYKDVFNNPLEWAGKCVQEYQAQAICLRLQGAHPDFGNKSAEEEARLIKDLLKALDVPLIILGCGDDNKDNEVLPVCSQAASGKRCLIGSAVGDNYRTLAVAVLADGHSIIAESPIDINIAKQLNILISDMGIPLERIVINPTIGALGYGLEYAYSIMERARLAALAGDKMMAMPFICFVGQETWRAKEAKAGEKEFPQWGPEAERGVAWESVTAVALLQAGADLLVMRHPKAIDCVRKYIEVSFKDNI